jgi:elongation factor P--(R)-beta-lysine ligase
LVFDRWLCFGDFECHALRQFDRNRCIIEKSDLTFHAFLQEGRRVSQHVRGYVDLLECCWVHEDVVFSVLIQVRVGDGFDESAFHRVGCLVANDRLHTVGDTTHIDCGCRRAFARVHGFGLEDDIELAVFVLDDVTFAHAAGDDFNHGNSLFFDGLRLSVARPIAAPNLKANPVTSPWFHPSKHEDRRPFLLARNRILGAVRQWFASRDFLEVDVAALAVSPGNEAHLHAFATELIHNDGSRSTRYLHTSPEFACKKLLAAGEERIFSLGHVFRNRERTLTHAPEFTMLEWYRVREPHRTIIEDTLALVRLAADVTGQDLWKWRGRDCSVSADAEWLTVNEAFVRYAGIDLFSTLDRDGRANRDALASISPVAFGRDESWSDIFSRILVEKVEPQLGNKRITVLYEYPAVEAALARTCSHDVRVAERFELYACGVELANGFGELTDADEQRRRFVEEMDIKQRVYGERYPIDEELLEALRLMPEASGVALGLDRVIMLATGATSIDQVQWTPAG